MCQTRRHAQSEAINVASLPYKHHHEIPNTSFPPSRKYQNIYMSTKIVICNDH